MKTSYRFTANKKISEVCGGINEYFDIDPTLVRIGFIILLLFGVLLYAIQWLVVPVKPL